MRARASICWKRYRGGTDDGGGGRASTTSTTGPRSTGTSRGATSCSPKAAMSSWVRRLGGPQDSQPAIQCCFCYVMLCYSHKCLPNSRLVSLYVVRIACGGFVGGAGRSRLWRVGNALQQLFQAEHIRGHALLVRIHMPSSSAPALLCSLHLLSRPRAEQSRVEVTHDFFLPLVGIFA
jgi:hypothetical protein